MTTRRAEVRILSNPREDNDRNAREESLEVVTFKTGVVALKREFGYRGETLTEHRLDAPPVFDGLATANERLYVSSTDGTVLCFAGQ